MKKLVIFSDGLDIDRIERLHRQFHGRVRLAYGWGTLLTNDFRGLVPDGKLDPISIVCKVVSADSRPTVKLSDNPAKALGIFDRTGSLKPGKMADVVLWNGNPFSNYSRPERVWIDGAEMYNASDPGKRPVSDFELGQVGEGDVK